MNISNLAICSFFFPDHFIPVLLGSSTMLFLFHAYIEIGGYRRSYQNEIRFLQGGLQVLLQSIKEMDPDKVSVNLQSALDTVAELETLQVVETI